MNAIVSQTRPNVVSETDRNDRLDPLGRQDYLSLQHIGRYLFAMQHLTAGMRVLDVACGTGYGTQMLAVHKCHPVGGDLDIAQLTIAKNKEGTIDGNYVALDVLRLPFRDESFDAVVSFETIEHVVQGREFLDEMHRVLKPGGKMICSTPNIAYTSHPFFHVKEYRPEEYFSLVEDKFGPSKRYGQYFKLRDRMIDKLMFLKRPHHPAFLPPYFALKVLGKALLFINKHIMEPLWGLFITRSGQQNASCPYRVTDYRGNRLLRIMVTISVK